MKFFSHGLLSLEFHIYQGLNDRLSLPRGFSCLILYFQLSVLFRGCLSTELEQLLVSLIHV